VLGVQALIAAIVIRFRQQSRLARETGSLDTPLEPVDNAAPVQDAPAGEAERDPRWHATYARG
jgi:hypothetical protein